MKYLLHICAIILLTITTQIGGIAYLIMLVSRLIFNRNSMLLSAVTFLAIYLLLTTATMFAAPMFGRVALPCALSSHPIRSQSLMYCALNRNYVTPELYALAMSLSDHIDKKFPGTTTLTLDANFPFISGFPLLPHLSHDDGEKLDFAFYYNDKNGNYAEGKTKSPIGYWGFDEQNSSTTCADKNRIISMRWNMDWFQIFTTPLGVNAARTKEAIEWLSINGRKMGLKKIFVEPYLAEKLGVSGPIIRFQGCRAARHDDHIHIQM